MSRRIRALALAALAACAPAAQAQTAAQTKEQLREAKAVAKAKAKIEKAGAGARVEVRLREGEKVKGNVGEIAGEHFTVVDRETGAETTVRYARVKSVRDRFIPRPLKVSALVIMGALTPVIVWGVVVVAKGGQ